MVHEKPLWHRIYFEPHYTDVCRAIGYLGCTYRRLTGIIEELGKTHGKEKVEAAIHQLATYEGQMTVNPKPDAHVSLRAEVRKLCWQLLGPTPEKWDEVYRDLKDPPPNPYLAKAPKKAKRQA